MKLDISCTNSPLIHACIWQDFCSYSSHGIFHLRFVVFSLALPTAKKLILWHEFQTLADFGASALTQFFSKFFIFMLFHSFVNVIMQLSLKLMKIPGVSLHKLKKRTSATNVIITKFECFLGTFGFGSLIPLANRLINVNWSPSMRNRWGTHKE